MKNNLRKVGFILGIAGALFVGSPKSVLAEAKLTYEGQKEVYITDNITIDVKLSDIENCIVGIGGRFIIDREYFELVSYEVMKEPYQTMMNPANYKFAGLSFDFVGLSEDATIFTLVLKPLKTGVTTLSFEEEELTDKTLVIADCTTNTLTIEIKEEEKIEEIEETKEQEEILEDVEDIVKEDIVSDLSITSARLRRDKALVVSNLLDSFKPQNIITFITDYKSNKVEDMPSKNLVSKIFNLLKRK